MTSAQVVETSVNVTSNSPSQDYTHPDDHNLPNYDMTPGFKPFTNYNQLIKIDLKKKTIKLGQLSELSINGPLIGRKNGAKSFNQSTSEVNQIKANSYYLRHSIENRSTVLEACAQTSPIFFLRAGYSTNSLFIPNRRGTYACDTVETVREQGRRITASFNLLLPFSN